MPLVRVQVRNEYGLGAPELYREANNDDPKAILDGVAVAGLVGILRQLGDLAEFAAEVFHGLQEELMATASKSHKLMIRVKHIETSLPSVENAVLAQRSHLHFAYTAGSKLHFRIREDQNHFIYSDLPRFIMDSYEECQDPPPLHLLDRFDRGGKGSCLKRYSDPTFFRRASANSDKANAKKILRNKKVRRSKRKRAWQRNGTVSRGASISDQSGRMYFASQSVCEQTSPSQNASIHDIVLKSEPEDQSNSCNSRIGSGYTESAFPQSYSSQSEELCRTKMMCNDSVDLDYVEEQSGVVNDSLPQRLSQEKTGPSSSCVNWDEKTEVVESTSYPHDCVATEMLPANFATDIPDSEDSNFRTIDKIDLEFDNENTPTSIFGPNLQEDFESEPENYVDALNTIESDYETDLDCQTKREVHQCSSFIDEKVEGGIHGHNVENQLSEFDVPPAYSSSDKATSWSESNLLWLESDSPELPLQMDAETSASRNEFATVYCGNVDSFEGLKTESAISNVPYSGSEESHLQGPISGKRVSSSSSSEISSTEQQLQVNGEFSNSHNVFDISYCGNDESFDGLETKSVLSNESVAISEEQNLQCPVSDNTNSTPRSSPNSCAKRLQVDEKSSNYDVSGIDYRENVDSLLTKSVVSNASFSGSEESDLQTPIRDNIPCSSSGFPNSNTEPPLKVDVNSCNSNSASGVVLSENVDHSDSLNTKSIISNTPYSGSEEPNIDSPVSDNIRSCSSNSQKYSSEISGMNVVSCWTNGGLLGLEPSKPPDCSNLNSDDQESMPRSEDGVVCPSGQRNVIKCDGYAETTDMSTMCSESILKGPSSEYSKLLHDDKVDVCKNTSWRAPPAYLDDKLGKSGDASRIDYVSRHNRKESYIVTTGAKEPISPDVKTKCVEVSQHEGEKSSQTEFGSGLLMNGFRSKASLDRNENPEPAISIRSCLFKQKSTDQSAQYQPFSETHFKEHLGTGLPLNSPSSSPPLEHMKISFQPVIGFETKLSLKFPEGIHGHESSRDLFPSFQLVPEPATPLHYDDLDSDDDTFSRSSPYISDDCLSQNSESSSEQWELGETTARKDHELYDALSRISLSEYALSSWEQKGTAHQSINVDCGLTSPHAVNGVESNPSSLFLDLPTFDALNPLSMQETESELDGVVFLESQFHKESKPSTPPLPPSQWRITRPFSDVAEDHHEDNLKLLGSTIPVQSKSSPLEQEQNIEANAFTPKSKPDKDLNNQKEAIQATNTKEMDEKEDFLNLIRTKSLGLRRAVTTRPTSTPKPLANVKVTAILEKANAIRQAVGTDDEEDDDTWSDT